MKSERSTASRIIRLRRAAGSVLKLQIRPKAEHDHVRNMDVAAALYNVLEGWAHVPPRSDIKPVEDFQRIFGAGNGNAGIGQLNYFGDATIVIGTAGRKSDHIVRTQRERSGKKGWDVKDRRYGYLQTQFLISRDWFARVSSDKRRAPFIQAKKFHPATDSVAIQPA
jgi:hypothetical protein